MGLFEAIAVSASGLNVQQKRVDVASQNLANISSTSTPEGGPYKHKSVMISSAPLGFDLSLQSFLKPKDMQGARITGVVEDNAPFNEIYNPNHPDADEKGILRMPNVNSTQEMIDIMQASKAYEANITVMNAAKNMVERTFQIGSA